jgi:hypothetical protein
MTENLARLGVGEYDKHTPVRGQPLNAVNPPAIALKRAIDGQVMAGEPRRDVAEHDLKRNELLGSGVERPAERTTAAPVTAIILGLNDTVVGQTCDTGRRISEGRKGRGCRDNRDQKGAHDAKHARIDRYRSLNPE